MNSLLESDPVFQAGRQAGVKDFCHHMRKYVSPAVLLMGWLEFINMGFPAAPDDLSKPKEE